MNFEDKVAASTPDGYALVTGWSDEANGITHDAYRTWIENIVNNLDDGEDMPQVMSFRVWKDKMREGVTDDLGFCHERCELCDALPGERYKVSALHPEKENLEYWACQDCMIFIANGEVPE